jgi:cyclic beta-1,2-glucan synthetase
MRTSPTNIGLWMLSALSAHDFGYMTVDQVVEKLAHTMETIGKLERYEGHLLNWYDVKTLVPLEPRYVSAVDSGNLLGALWSLEHGLDELIQRPVLAGTAFEGLRDTGEILKQVVEQKSVPGLNGHALDALMRAWETPPARIADALRLLRRVEGSVRALADATHESADVETGAAYWASQMEEQVSACLRIRDRYLTWIEILDEKTEEEVAHLGLKALFAIRQGLYRAPSLLDLAHGHIGCIPILQSIREKASSAATPLFEWLDRLMEAFTKSVWLDRKSVV